MCDLADLLETLEIVNKPLKGLCAYMNVYTTLWIGSLHPSLQPPPPPNKGSQRLSNFGIEIQ